jgi:hypothetical protein
MVEANFFTNFLGVGFSGLVLFCLDSYHYGENKMILVSVSWSFAIIAFKA